MLPDIERVVGFKELSALIASLDINEAASRMLGDPGRQEKAEGSERMRRSATLKQFTNFDQRDLRKEEWPPGSVQSPCESL
jgi:hypothetical protein